MTEVTFWNGQPCQARKVTLVVADADFPRYWARPFVGQRRNAVEVSYFDEPFYLDDDAYERPEEEQRAIERILGADNVSPQVVAAGQGWRKVTEGHGSSAYSHRDLTPEPGTVEAR